MNDIVVDTSAVGYFENPPDEDVKQFILWIKQEGILATSMPILIEMKRAVQGSCDSSLVAIINILLRDGRLKVKSESELDTFQFTRARIREFRSNKKDWPHIKLVMITMRKLCITRDKNLCYDINLFKLQGACAAGHPRLLAYKTITIG